MSNWDLIYVDNVGHVAVDLDNVPEEYEDYVENDEENTKQEDETNDC